MFILKKVLTPFILPPGIFILLLIISGIWFYTKKNRSAGVIQIVIGVLMWILALGPVSGALYRGLEGEFTLPKEIGGDVLILLGGGINDQAPDLSGMGAPSPELLQRIVTAIRLYKRLNIPILATGASFTRSQITEASIIKRYLIDLGVPQDLIILEDRARDTFENAKFAKSICDRFGFRKPVLITSGYHMKRAVLSFERAGLKVIPFPAAFKSPKALPFVWRDILPNDYHGKYLALKEYIGLFVYRYAY